MFTTIKLKQGADIKQPHWSTLDSGITFYSTTYGRNKGPLSTFQKKPQE